MPTSRTRPLASGDSGAAGEAVEAPDDPLVHALGLRRLRVVLVVDVDVVEDVLAVAEHAPDAVADDRRQLVGEGRVVGAHHGDRRREHLGMAVVVLQALARERRPAGRGADHEPAAARVAEGPRLVAGPLEPEHRVEDVEGDHRHAVRGVRRAGGLQRGHRAGLGDPLLQHLAVRRLAVGEHELGVDRLVALAEGGVDADLLEQRVHAERARLVRDDRDDPRAELRVPDEVPQQPGEDHRRATRRSCCRRRTRRRPRRRRRAGRGARTTRRGSGPPSARRRSSMYRDLVGVRARVEVRGVAELVVGDRQLQAVAEDAQLVLVELLGLVGDVARLDAPAEGPALDGLGQDDRRGAA